MEQLHNMQSYQIILITALQVSLKDQSGHQTLLVQNMNSHNREGILYEINQALKSKYQTF